MFLPTSFKEELIKYFENWGSSKVESFNRKKRVVNNIRPIKLGDR